MNYRPMILAAALALSAHAAPAAAEPRAVIELFTSQGCSSCPPADRLLGQFAQDPSLIALSLPVDYWNYLGWKDTLALHSDSERQRNYSLVRGDREVYTPQVVVNGVMHALGSNKEAIEKAIATSRQNAHPLTLPIKLDVVDGAVTVHVPASTEEMQVADVWLCPVTGKVRVAIERGENRGHTLAYHNVVRRWIKLGTWSGKAETFRVKLTELPNGKFSLADIDHAAVLVQSGSDDKPGIILGAAMAPLPATRSVQDTHLSSPR
ncbi:MAG TPA: DUF1223 domain-containing protein [Pseudolabrys sp.]|nr:DUF1223 domain-containing protein [Pseudolabrys sp.]